MPREFNYSTPAPLPMFIPIFYREGNFGATINICSLKYCLSFMKIALFSLQFFENAKPNTY